MLVRSVVIPPRGDGFTLVCHAGAGGRIKELSAEEESKFSDALASAYRVGEQILGDGRSALDAVCAVVKEFEDCPLFNAGKGSALTLDGRVEMDACVMDNAGNAGAVTCSTQARNTVLLARHVMERTPHVLLTHPTPELVQAAGLELMPPDYFVTEARKAQLQRILASEEAPLKHGTVGAVALDKYGQLAAATSTGGISKQLPGRIGDTPIVGAGTWVGRDLVAISCTGDGEAFLQGVVAHDIWARMKYGSENILQAVENTFAQEVDPRNSTGGLIAVTKDGHALLAHNSQMMFAAFCEGNGVTVHNVSTWC